MLQGSIGPRVARVASTGHVWHGGPAKVQTDLDMGANGSSRRTGGPGGEIPGAVFLFIMLAIAGTTEPSSRGDPRGPCHEDLGSLAYVTRGQ